MRNNKGLVGQLIIFIVVVAISAGFIYAVYYSGNQVAAEVFYNDDLRSISVIADAVVNSPNCLLYTEKDILFQPPKIVATAGIIDWEKVSDQKKDCIRKGPYLWNANVTDNTEASVRNVAGYDADSCIEIGGRSLPVLIKKAGDLHNGLVHVSIASKDAFAAFSRQQNEMQMTLKNIGTCPSNFKVAATVLNKSNGAEMGNVQISCTPGESGSLDVNKTAGFSCALPPDDLSQYELKVEISPDGMPYYAKEYRVGL